jgi:hypothetical protein
MKILVIGAAGMLGHHALVADAHFLDAKCGPAGRNTLADANISNNIGI